MKTVILKIETEEQLISITNAITTFVELERNLVLDDTITTVEELQNLAKLAPTELQLKLNQMHRYAFDAVKRLTTAIDLQHKIELLDKES